MMVGVGVGSRNLQYLSACGGSFEEWFILICTWSFVYT